MKVCYAIYYRSACLMKFIGMNALMLASQRGHAEIVYFLIRAGAVMDEQTAQGSTALMLACKRGHEKCAEVLVSMGAEIYMRDRRNRTARDTALKRNHTALLRWLDTQVQVQRIQELKNKQRSALIKDIRKKFTEGSLVLTKMEAFVADLYNAVKITAYHGTSNVALPLPPLPRPLHVTEKQLTSAEQLLDDFELSSHKLPYVSKDPKHVLQVMRDILYQEEIRAVQKVPVFRSAYCPYYPPAKRVPNYADWQWPSLFQR